MAEPATPVTPSLEQSAAPRHRTPPAAWFGVIASVVAGALLIAAVDEVPQPDADFTHAESFLPDDGTARLALYEDGAKWIIESAYSIGSPYLILQPPGSGEQQIAYLEGIGLDVAEQRFWRQTWTDVVGERDQLTEVYHLTESGVRAMTLTGGELGFSYAPGIIVLPADVHDGSTWQGEGDAWPQQFLQYTYTGSARAGDDGCMITTLAIDYLDPSQDGAVALATTEESTWCPGRGVVASSFTNDGVEGAMSVAGLGERTVAGATESALDFSGAEEWSEASVPLLSRDVTFGESPLTGATDGVAAATSSGVVVFNSGTDLMAYGVAEDGQYVREWIAHPGGEVVQLTTIGDVVLVATTDRRLQAYDDHGRRAWAAEFGDIVNSLPVSDGAGGVIVTSLDGEVRRLDLKTGDEVWSASLAGDTDVAPAVADGLVYTVDRSNTWTALDLETGEVAWSHGFELGELVVGGAGVAYAADGYGGIYARDADTGAALWRGPLPGLVQQGAVLDERLVLQTTEGTFGYDEVGGIRWSTADKYGIVSDGERLVSLGYDAVSVLDADGNVISSWPVSPPTIDISNSLVALPGGVWIVTTTFQATEVTAR